MLEELGGRRGDGGGEMTQIQNWTSGRGDESDWE